MPISRRHVSSGPTLVPVIMLIRKYSILQNTRNSTQGDKSPVDVIITDSALLKRILETSKMMAAFEFVPDNWNIIADQWTRQGLAIYVGSSLVTDLNDQLGFSNIPEIFRSEAFLEKFKNSASGKAIFVQWHGTFRSITSLYAIDVAIFTSLYSDGLFRTRLTASSSNKRRKPIKGGYMTIVHNQFDTVEDMACLVLIFIAGFAHSDGLSAAATRQSREKGKKGKGIKAHQHAELINTQRRQAEADKRAKIAFNRAKREKNRLAAQVMSSKAAFAEKTTAKPEDIAEEEGYGEGEGIGEDDGIGEGDDLTEEQGDEEKEGVASGTGNMPVDDPEDRGEGSSTLTVGAAIRYSARETALDDEELDDEEYIDSKMFFSN